MRYLVEGAGKGVQVFLMITLQQGEHRCHFNVAVADFVLEYSDNAIFVRESMHVVRIGLACLRSLLELD